MSIRSKLVVGIGLAFLVGTSVLADEGESMEEDRITVCDLILPAETGEQIYIDQGTFVILDEILEDDAVIHFKQYRGIVPRLCLRTQHKTVTGYGLVLRLEPNENGEVLHEMIPDTVVEVLSNENGWSKVIYRGRCGFCLTSGLS